MNKDFDLKCMRTNNMYWPLMKDTITLTDRIKMAKFLLFTSKLTNGPKVREFEEKWSNWLGSDYSLYVSSGSTANSLLVSSVKELYGLKDGDKVLLPACTWVTNVAPIIQAGFTPIFCDINLKNFSFDEEDLKYISKVHSDIKLIFITHLLGLSANNEICQELFPNALVIEDICESHGVRDFGGEKRGKNSLGSTFSFYFGHHMTTIEGGMVSTNNRELYELMRMKRSHGMARECTPEKYEQYVMENPDISKQFLFMTDGYNFRNHEVCAVLGISQLKRLDSMIEVRKNNYRKFYSSLERNSNKFFLPEHQSGNSSFCFPIICKDSSNVLKLKEIFDKKQIEYRPIVSGNLLRHPAFRKYRICKNKTNLNVEVLHNNGVYIGNSHFVNDSQMEVLSNILDSIK
jgi:CDP-6-deoxy-D-xylo-4-hexulose-3-dehydrase